jgi:hypothetical protein
MPEETTELYTCLSCDRTDCESLDSLDRCADCSIICEKLLGGR